MTRRVRISSAEARRIALAAQGFDRGRPTGSPGARQFRRIIETLGLLQLDFVNVLIPAHYLVVWSRLGCYDRQRFDKFVYGSGEFTEQWAHEASIVPTDAWPLLAHRRARWEPHANNPVRRLRNRENYLAAVLDQVRRDGGLTSNALPDVPGPKRKAGDWHRSVPRWAMEYHFARGDLAVRQRLPNFQRVYDLSERVIPEQHWQQEMSTAEAERELLYRASRALGVASLHDLADYYRMSPRSAAPRLAELVRAGHLHEVSVEHWQVPAYLSSDARFPRSIAGSSLLSPFDPVVWFRPRAERLFDFHYRIEIYVPENKRKWGYYVLPFRMGDDVVARVDLKAERKDGKLAVQAAHLEEGADRVATAKALSTELTHLCEWLGLGRINVRRHNRFAQELSRQCV